MLTSDPSHFDIVLLDLMMPRVSGLDVVQTLRANPDFASLPVLMMSAKSHQDVVSDAIWKGATDFCMKPLDGVCLLTRLDTMLENAREAQDRAAQAKKVRVSRAPSGSDMEEADNGEVGQRSHSDTPFSHSDTPAGAVYAALTLSFSADSSAAVQFLEIVFKFVEQTAAVIAGRTCCCADGSIFILAEGEDGEARLQGVAEKIQAWFRENVTVGLVLFIGIAPPSALHVASFGDKTVTMGPSVGAAFCRALHSAHSDCLTEARGVRAITRGPFSDAGDGDGGPSPSTATASISLATPATARLAAEERADKFFGDFATDLSVTPHPRRPAEKPDLGATGAIQSTTRPFGKTLDDAQGRVLAASLAQAQCLHRLQQVLLAQCKTYERRLAEAQTARAA
jgi:CheY-like chemotaxis protein